MTKFGIHISKDTVFGDYGTIGDAINHITSEYDLDLCQIFTHGPQTRTRTHYDAEHIRKLDKADIYVHATYITDGYWTAVEEKGKPRLRGYYKHIQDQLNSVAEIGGKGLVFHITRITIPMIISGANLIAKNVKQPHGVKIIFEFRAMKPGADCSYERAERVNELAAELSKVNIDWGFCIDTSHMWSTGVPMDKVAVVENWFRELKCANRIKLFHLNAANKNTFAVGQDVHVIPFAPDDDIWGPLTKTTDPAKLSDADFKKIQASTLGILLRWAKKHNVSIVGEWKRGSKEQFIFAIKIIKRLLHQS